MNGRKSFGGGGGGRGRGGQGGAQQGKDGQQRRPMFRRRKELTSASNPSLPLSVHRAGVEYPAASFLAWPYFIFLDYFTSAPTDGQFAALNDFNGDDPATSGFVNRRELYQDVTLPGSTTTLEFDYRGAWELFRFDNTRDRTFSVEVEPAGGGATLRSQTILIAPVNTYEEDTDNPSGGMGNYPPAVVDLSAFASQSVRLKFVWDIPEPGSGFGFFQLDNIRLNTSSNPNTAPAVTITSPANGSSSTLGQSVAFSATATDAEDGNLSGSISWTSDRHGVIGSGATITTSALALGTHTITAAVTDSDGLGGSGSITVTVNPVTANTPPTVTIDAPAANTTFVRGSSIAFSGSATDAQDGSISSGLSWSSDLDGVIGSGASFSTTGLRGGSHVVTASITDTGGLSGSASISIVVNVDNLATADVSTARGTITSGSFQQTWSDDDAYEVLTEGVQGNNPSRRRSLLEHTWRFDVAAGSQYVFTVNAYRSGAEDHFTFAYSRDNVVFTPMVTVVATSDTDTLQAYAFPQDVAGTVYVRVQDTDSTIGNTQLDTLFVDSLAITTLFAGGSGGASITLAATGLKVKGFQHVELAWSGATAPSVTIARNGVVIRTVSNPGPSGGTYIDDIGIKGTGTYTYQVCESGAGGACSNSATVAF